MKRHSCSGVTYLEVLAVVCLIALIAAILFPVFQKVPYRPRHGTCQSNLKQLGLAYVQYTQDYDEKYPQGVNTAGNGWAGKVYPYVKSAWVYRCPDEDAPAPAVSYAQNQALTGQPLSTFNAPASTVELYEFTTPNCDPSQPETVSATGLTAPQNSTRHASSNQPNGLNFAAADGHVKYLGPAQVSSGPNAARPKSGAAFAMTFAVR